MVRFAWDSHSTKKKKMVAFVFACFLLFLPKGTAMNLKVQLRTNRSRLIFYLGKCGRLEKVK